MFDCCEFVRSCWLCTLDRCGQVLSGFDDAICSGDVGDGEGMVFELPGVSQSDGAGFEYTFDGSVMLQGWCEIPCFDGMVVPCALTNELEMHQYFGAGWGHGRRVE